MKSSKPICLMLFGIAVILSTIGFTARSADFAMVSLFIVPIGLLFSLIGLIWVFKEKQRQGAAGYSGGAFFCLDFLFRL